MSGFTARGVRAAVVGTGLIGGSILLRLREGGVDVRGWDPNADTRRVGRERGLTFAEELVEAVRDRDVVFLCGPLTTMPDTLIQVVEATGGECVVTDVGSVKSTMASFSVAKGLAHRFVPGHPMAGTEGSGLTAADPGLFRGAAWVLCPLPEGEISRFRWLARLIIEVFGARLVPMSPTVHDSVVALSSHVPHLLAGSLAGAVARSSLRDAIVGLAAGSFRDGTRVAGAPSRRTADMLINNREASLRQLDLVRDFLADLSSALGDDDVERLADLFLESRGLRERLLTRPSVPAARSFPLAADAGAELDFLWGLGEAGGCLTDCRIDDSTVTYQLVHPDR